MCRIHNVRPRPLHAALVAPLVVLATAVGASDDFQTWNSIAVTWLQHEHVSLITSGHIRFVDDSSEFSLYRIAQRATTSPAPWLSAGLGYRFGETKSDGEFRKQHRGEIQLTPRWTFADRLGLSLRNRYEVRATEGTGGLNTRMRHRVRARWATPEWAPLTALFVSNEVIVDLDRADLSETRFIPVGLQFAVHPRARLRVGYMLRSIHRDSWTHVHVLVTTLALR